MWLSFTNVYLQKKKIYFENNYVLNYYYYYMHYGKKQIKNDKANL